MLGPKLDLSSKAPIVQRPGGNQSCRNRNRAMAKLTSLKLSFSPSIPQPQISFLTAQIKKILFALSPSAPSHRQQRSHQLIGAFSFLLVSSNIYCHHSPGHRVWRTDNDSGFPSQFFFHSDVLALQKLLFWSYPSTAQVSASFFLTQG